MKNKKMKGEIQIMKYVVTVNGEKYEVEVEKVSGRSGSLSRQPMERGPRARVEAPAAPAVAVPVAAAAPAAPVVEKAAPVAAASTGGAAKAVLSPMPGVILDIKVKEGDAVSSGQTVIILEAMKMENEIVSEFAGTVASLKVKKGDTVDTDAVLVEIR